MNRLLAILVPILVLLSVQVQGEETSPIEGRIEVFNEKSHPVWIGLFSNPPSEGLRALSWTLVETEGFQLSIPQEFEEVFLLALQKDSIPLMKRISSNHLASEVVLNFAKGQSLRGTVLSEDEFPIPDAELSISCNDLSSIPIPDEARSTWKSDSDGNFVISGLSTGECTVDIVPGAELPLETFEVQIDSKDNAVNFSLTNICFVSGRVVDYEGETVSDAEVTADVSFGGWFSTSSDKNGTFDFGPFLKSTSIYLFARHNTNGSTRNLKTVAGKHDIVLRLSRLTRIVGMVVDSKTGDPLDEFILHVRRQHSGVKFPHKETEGRISVMVDSNSHSVAVEAPGYVYHWEDATFVAGVEYDLGTVELEPGKILTGRVYDASSGESIPGAKLSQFMDPGERVFGSEGLQIRYFAQTIKATTDDEGTFSIGPLPFEDVKLSVYAPGYEGPTIVVNGELESLDIPLSPFQPSRTRIRGIVQTNYGEPVSGMVQINSDAGGGAGHGNNEDGTFDRGVLPGSFEVYAYTKFGQSNTEKVSLQEGETVNLTLTVDSRGRLSGVIEGLQAGEEVLLRITDPWDQPIRNGSRWGNGDFLVEGVPPGKYLVYATSDTNREIDKAFEIRGEDGEAYVELIFPGESRLYGSVTSGAYENHEIRVRATPREDASTTGWSEVHDDGNYEIQGLEDGVYSVAAYRRSYNLLSELRGQLGPSQEIVVQGDTQLGISLGGSRRTITQSGSYSVSGTIHPIDDAIDGIVSISSSRVNKSQQLAADDQGQFSFKGLPTGRYSLSVIVEGFVAYRETLSVGSSIEGHYVTLEPIPQGSLQISGRVDPSIRADGAFISVLRQSDGARVRSVQVEEGGGFVIEQLVPDEYELSLYIPGLGDLQKEISLDASIEGLNISFDSKKQ